MQSGLQVHSALYIRILKTIIERELILTSEHYISAANGHTQSRVIVCFVLLFMIAYAEGPFLE